jgi:putative protein kinase ArgK-like GTPase of G3E family
MPETMNEEPKAEQEPPKSDLASQEALDARLELNRRMLKREWEEALSAALKVEREAAQQTAYSYVTSAIRDFKNELESAGREREREESRKKTDRQMEWLNRFLAGVIGFVICMFFGIAAQQCSQVGERISTLESKEKK